MEGVREIKEGMKNKEKDGGIVASYVSFCGFVQTNWSLLAMISSVSCEGILFL
jgi:hypothetical protein